MKLWPRIRPFKTPDADDEAAQWLAHLDGRPPRLSDDVRLETWLAANPRNRTAIERAANACDVASRHAAAPEILEMRHAALTARGDNRSRPWALVASIAAIALSVSAVWTALHGPLDVAERQSTAAASVNSAPERQPTLYATATGERSTISLPDGSVVTLDTQSSLEVIYSDTERGIRLLRGQAFFEVAKHQPVPFRVYAGGRRITALGTRFNVRLDGARVRVALVEGHVRVVATPTAGPTSMPIQQVTMNPGEILDANATAPMTVTTADAKRTASWRDGVAVFVDIRLLDAVAEMNRYASHPMLIAGERVREYRVSGVFKIDEPERFAEAVATVFPLSLDRAPDGSVVLRQRTP